MLDFGLTQIRVSQGTEGQCTLPSSLLQTAGWRQGDVVTLQFGSARVRARLRATEDNSWSISPGVLHSLGPLPRRTNYQLDSNQQLIRFGPLIGIMTTWAMSPYFGSMMVAAAKQGMMAVVFRPTDLVTGDGRMEAWALVSGSIQRVVVPWPDVVYNRIPNRGGEIHSSTILCKRLLARRGIPIFNRMFFHKWRIYRLLRGDAAGNAHLPESHPLTHIGQVLAMLHRYPMVYLKPNGGSKGMGIVKVNRLSNGGFTVSYRRGSHNYQLAGANWAETEQLVKRGMYHRSYVIQEGLPLARFHGRPFDVRVTLYKDSNGRWICCGPAAKIAGKGSITTHVHNGGRIVPLRTALSYSFGEKAEQIREGINRTSIEVAEAVERVTHLQLGELGLDIGVTASGRMAMFEANSKPGRAIFDPSWAKSDRNQSLFFLCGYAARLAGFARKEG